MSKPEIVRRTIYILAPLLWMLIHGILLCRAEVTCTKQADGSWICSGDGTSTGQTVVTNIVGVCTNCVAMSPEDCQSMKDQLSSDLGFQLGLLNEASAEINIAKSSIDDLIDEGSDFTGITDYSTSAFGTSAAASSAVQSSSQYQYVSSYRSSPLTSSQIQTAGGTAVNSIYNYYISSVEPTLDSVYSSLNIIDEKNTAVRSSITAVQTTVNNINCSACTASYDGAASSTNSSGGSATCSECPCKEQFDALLEVQKNIRSKVYDISNTVAVISSTAKSIEKGVKALQSYLKQAYYGNTGIVVDNGLNSWTNVYTLGSSSLYSYNKSNVFERIELLLYSLTELNVNLNNAGNFMTGAASSISQFQDALDSSEQSLTSSLTEKKQQLSSFGDSVKGLFNALRPVGVSSFSGSAARALPHFDVQFGGVDVQAPSVSLDSEMMSTSGDLIDLMRICFQLVYLLTALLCIWKFYTYFWEKVVLAVKYTAELLHGLFG